MARWHSGRIIQQKYFLSSICFLPSNTNIDRAIKTRIVPDILEDEFRIGSRLMDGAEEAFGQSQDSIWVFWLRVPKTTH